MAEIAPGNFSGQRFVVRGQKAWFLSATLAEGACGAHAGLFQRHHARAQQ
jgi:hypothetical protein